MQKERKSCPYIRATAKIQSYPQEEWKEFFFASHEKMNRRYAVSNFGRFASFVEDLRIDGVLLKLGLMTNRRYYMVRGSYVHDVIVKGVKKRKVVEEKILIHKLVAQIFVKNPENKEFAVHIDYDTYNNHADNLMWLNAKESYAYRMNNPKNEGRVKKRRLRGLKLTTATAMIVKRMAIEGKTRQKIIAKQFGISEMAVYRMKVGENWGHLQIDDISKN